MQIIDSDGNTVNLYSYDEWGNILSQAEQIKNPFKYAGEIYDAETGLYYLRARYYDPAVGRFISKDPYEGKITNPLSLNLYAYVFNNPLIYVDPTGHLAQGDYLGYNLNVVLDDVKKLQARLNQLGYNSGIVDGRFGNRTLAAVNAYKSNMGLGNDGWAYGKVGRETWESLGFSVIQRVKYDQNYKASVNRKDTTPDYFSVNANVAVPNPITGTLVGGTGQLSLDRNGSFYGGIGGTAGKSATGVSGSATAGWILPAFNEGNKSKLDSFMTGHSFNASAGAGGGGGYTYVPGVGKAFEEGIFTPQAGGSYHYSWKLFNIKYIRWGDE